LLSLQACSVSLQHDLTEEDANEIYVVLQNQAIDADKVKEGEGKETRYVITVPKAQVKVASELLRAHSLPRQKADGLAIFKQTKGMIPTQTEERAMFIEALGGEVSNALGRVPGVLEVRTIVMLPESNDLTQPEKKPQPSASVLIKYMQGDDSEHLPISIEEVQQFVAASVPELKKENVKVIMKVAKLVTEKPDEASQTEMHLGVRMHKSSVGTFNAIIGVFAGLFILLAGAVVGLLVIRKPARPAPRKTQAEG
jgi:type III secretion protein J